MAQFDITPREHTCLELISTRDGQKSETLIWHSKVKLSGPSGRTATGGHFRLKKSHLRLILKGNIDSCTWSGDVNNTRRLKINNIAVGIEGMQGFVV